MCKCRLGYAKLGSDRTWVGCWELPSGAHHALKVVATCETANMRCDQRVLLPQKGTTQLLLPDTLVVAFLFTSSFQQRYATEVQ